MFDRMTHERPYSDDTAKEIDLEVAQLIKEAAGRAEIVLKANMRSLKKLADALIEEETLEEDGVLKLLKDAILPKEAMLY